MNTRQASLVGKIHKSCQLRKPDILKKTGHRASHIIITFDIYFVFSKYILNNCCKKVKCLHHNNLTVIKGSSVKVIIQQVRDFFLTVSKNCQILLVW